MKFNSNKRKNSEGFFRELPLSVSCLVDDLKEQFLLDHFKVGFSNRVLFEKFRNFKWPLWLQKLSDFNNSEYRSNPNPLLLNNFFREWQSFTNYISTGEIQIDRSGMISGPGNSQWSVEFWILRNGKIIRPQKDISNVGAKRDIKSGEITVSWHNDGIQFSQRIAGARSSTDEALISVELLSKKESSKTFLVCSIRPYNNLSLGNFYSVSINPESKLISINNKNLFGFEKKPDIVLTGSGKTGDIDFETEENTFSSECPHGMAAMALLYKLDSGKNIFNFRVSLSHESELSPAVLNYASLYKEFSQFTEIRLGENIKVDVTDKIFTQAFYQSKLSILNINRIELKPDDVESFRKLFFYIYSLCRTGDFAKAEELLRFKIDSFSFNYKKPDFLQAIKGCFIITSFHEIFIHKRETEFLDRYYHEIKNISDYIYIISVNIHSADTNMNNSSMTRIVKTRSVEDLLNIYAAFSGASYIARCRGIFGDEAKFKNESVRIQSIITESLRSAEYKKLTGKEKVLFGIFSLPEKVLSGIKKDEYVDFLESILSESGYPVISNMNGIDMFTSSVFLNHLIMAGAETFNEYYKEFMDLYDDFHVFPEFIDPVSKHGIAGDGNSKIINSIFFSLLRNRLFIDGQDRLELFPMADESWFKSESRIRVENAPTRYGIISFYIDVLEKEIRLSLAGSPKYLPADILINIPVKTSILSGDDFILKKKTGDSYLISGWPSSVRFAIPSKNPSVEASEL